MMPELELSLETGVTDLQLSDKQLEYFRRLELNSIKKRLDNLEFVQSKGGLFDAEARLQVKELAEN